MHIETVARAKHLRTVLARVGVAVGEMDVFNMFTHVAAVFCQLATENALVVNHTLHKLSSQVVVQVEGSPTTATCNGQRLRYIKDTVLVLQCVRENLIP